MSATAWTIRVARADEVAAMQAVELDAAVAYEALPSYRFCVGLPARDRDEHARVRRDGVPLAADMAGAVVGFALGCPVDGRLHVLEIAVAHRCQGRGIGRALLAELESWALARGFAEATLTTYRDVPWNAPFYARLGYRPFRPGPERTGLIGLIADEVAAGFDREPRLAMRKTLPMPPG